MNLAPLALMVLSLTLASCTTLSDQRSGDTMIQLSEEQIRFDKENRAIYNSGQIREAYEGAEERFKNHPDDLYCKFNYATMAGDYSYDEGLALEKSQELRELAKRLLKEVYEDPRRNLYSDKVVHRIRNEYYYFHEMPEEQFKLGEEDIGKGDQRGGHYSMCVGASGQAQKLRQQGSKAAAQQWAATSLEHFKAFEQLDPTWYNINYFAALSAAILGRLDEAEHLFREQYRKQGKPVDENAVKKFKTEAQALL